MRRLVRSGRGWAALALLSMATMVVSAQERAATPVTQGALVAADGKQWLSYGRDYAETHHSPLNAINAANVSRLGLAWTVDVGSVGQVEATPLVSDGVIYGTTAWSRVFAPHGVSDSVVKKLNDAINSVLNDPGAQSQFKTLQTQLRQGDAVDAAAFFQRDVAQWKTMITGIGLINK